MRRQNRIAVFLTLPIVVLLWLVGWSLYFFGSGKKRVVATKKSPNEDLKFAVLMPERETAEQPFIAE